MFLGEARGLGPAYKNSQVDRVGHWECTVGSLKFRSPEESAKGTKLV